MHFHDNSEILSEGVVSHISSVCVTGLPTSRMQRAYLVCVEYIQADVLAIEVLYLLRDLKNIAEKKNRAYDTLTLGDKHQFNLAAVLPLEGLCLLSDEQKKKKKRTVFPFETPGWLLVRDISNHTAPRL